MCPKIYDMKTEAYICESCGKKGFLQVENDVNMCSLPCPKCRIPNLSVTDIDMVIHTNL